MLTIEGKLLEKIKKQDDEEIIEDILRGNGFDDPIVKYKDYGKGKKRIAIIDGENVFDIKIDGEESKVDTKVKPKVKEAVNTLTKETVKRDIEAELEAQRPKVFVGDSSKLHGKVVSKDGKGKPVYDAYMNNEGKRINGLLALLAQLEVDEKKDNRPMTKMEQSIVHSMRREK